MYMIYPQTIRPIKIINRFFLREVFLSVDFITDYNTYINTGNYRFEGELINYRNEEQLEPVNRIS